MTSPEYCDQACTSTACQKSPSFTGKRSGLKINLKSGIASVLEMENSADETISTRMNNSNKNEDKIYLHHSHRIANSLSPGTLLVNSIANLNDFNTPIKDEILMNPNGFLKNAYQVPDIIQDENACYIDSKTERLFLMGEVNDCLSVLNLFLIYIFCRLFT